MNILVVEDDGETAAQIRDALVRQGHVVDLAADGTTGFSLASARNFDVAIVDRMLPGLDGLSLVRKLRSRGTPTAVLFLTNLGGIDDRVEGPGSRRRRLSSQAVCDGRTAGTGERAWASTEH